MIDAIVLPDAGREYCTFTLSADTPAGDLDVSFDGGASWSPLERVDTTHARVLVAGPDATDNPAETVVVPVGLHPVFLRITAGLEHVIRMSPKALVVERQP